MASKVTRRRCAAFFARFLLTFFLSGSIKFGGVLFESISSSDGFSYWSAGLLFILPYAIARMLGPAVTVILDDVSPRILATFGGFLFGAGFCCSGLYQLTPGYLFPCFIISGLGLACMHLPTVLCLVKAFGEDIRSIMPIAMLGSYAGIAVIPNLAAYVQLEYGTRSALLLFGALGWNLVPCGLLLFDEVGHTCTKTTDKEKIENNSTYELKSMSDKDESDSEVTNKSVINYLIKSVQKMFENFAIFTDLVFLFFFVVANLRKIPNDVWTLYLIPQAESSGLSLRTAALVGSIGGVGGICGRFLAAVSFKIPSNTPLYLFGFYFILNGFVFVVMATVVYSSGYVWPHCITSFFNGLLLSTQSGMIAGIIHLLIAPEHYLNAFGLIDLGNGLWTILAGFGPGALIDVSVGFQTIFIVLGYISLLNGFLIFITTGIKYFKNR